MYKTLFTMKALYLWLLNDASLKFVNMCDVRYYENEHKVNIYD